MNGFDRTGPHFSVHSEALPGALPIDRMNLRSIPALTCNSLFNFYKILAFLLHVQHLNT